MRQVLALTVVHQNTRRSFAGIAHRYESYNDGMVETARIDGLGFISLVFHVANGACTY
jgi:hypothetical protein